MTFQPFHCIKLMKNDFSTSALIHHLPLFQVSRLTTSSPQWKVIVSAQTHTVLLNDEDKHRCLV